MRKSLKGFDFGGTQTADIGVTEKTIAPLLENYSKYSDDFSCWLSGDRSLPFGLLVSPPRLGHWSGFAYENMLYDRLIFLFLHKYVHA